MKFFNKKILLVLWIVILNDLFCYAQYSPGDIILISTNRYETSKIEAEWFDVTKSHKIADDGTEDTSIRPAIISAGDNITYVSELVNEIVLNYNIYVGAGGGKFKVNYHHKKLTELGNIRYWLDGVYMGGSKRAAQSTLPVGVSEWQDFFDTKIVELTEGRHTFGFKINRSNSHFVDYFELIPIDGELPAAEESLEDVTLTVNAQNGVVEQIPNRGGSNLKGDLISLKAIPEEGYKFVSWSENEALIGESTANPVGIELNSSKTITAHFEEAEPEFVLTHPHIWVNTSDKQKILENIANHDWATSMHAQLISRQADSKDSHGTSPQNILSDIPLIPGDRTEHREVLNKAAECAILYYLTEDEDYAQIAGDILYHYVKRLENEDPLTLQFYTPNFNWMISTREHYPKIGIVYDFIQPFLVKEGTQVNKLESGVITSVDFDFEAAQKTFKMLSESVLKVGGLKSNHSVLELTGALYNVLCISDNAERESYFNRLWNGDTKQDAITWMIDNFTEEEGMWPESVGYAKATHNRVLIGLNVIDRYKPELNVIKENLHLLDGIFIFENYKYPNGRQISYGDGHRDESETDFMIRSVLAISDRLNLSDYKQKAFSTLKKLYDQTGGYNPVVETQSLEWDNPLQLLWGVDIPDEVDASDIPLYSTITAKYAGLVMQRNYVQGNNEDHGLMYYTGGATYVHSHASGIDMELYGAGYVIGPEYGSNTYGTDIHEQYAVSHAAHNTVIVNGVSKRGEKTDGNSTWQNIVDEIVLEACEPKAYENPISPNFSFSSQYLDDSFNNCDQQRTNSIVRTSETSGYYVDVFRSKSKGVNSFHDYLFHGLGDALTLKEGNLELSLTSTPNRYQNDIGDDRKQPGWRWFTDARTSAETSGSVIARFDLNESNKYLHVNVPASLSREYSTALAPESRFVSNGYDSKKTQIFVMRKSGEAWDEPFVAIYEPSGNNTSTIRSTEMLELNNKVVGVKVVSRVDDTTITDYVLSNDDADASIHLTNDNISFQGRFAIVRKAKKGSNVDITLYIGSGQQLTYENNTLNADSDGKGLLETSITGVNDDLLINKIKVYPNPSENGVFQLSECVQFKVYNMEGVVIAADETNMIDLSNYPAGFYFLEIGASTTRLVKK
ncbi:InlB B-repeat-containing protein [Labilibacter marinus]|uniref:InlB B-repeat-containing protein n=1 Tax=Labilibacter marinus TaxID=1477105 RepID=UPI000830F888|nr:T9SS type A sorting domain-containing protein [Labilibacter marinus]